MVNVKSSLLTPNLPTISTWIRASFLLAAVHQGRAQTTQAQCNSTNWTWSFNSKRQSPCLVAAYLLAPCTGGQSTVPALPPRRSYINSNPNSCSCSTVVYSVMSACGGCQTESAVNWSSWRANCTDSMISIKEYPNHISSATAVPAWAYMDVVTPDFFDAQNARLLANLPESTVGNDEVLTSSSTSLLTTSSETPESAPVGTSDKPSNTPAIIGGTVGGVLGLGLIIALVLYLLKQGGNKKNRRQPPSAAFASARATPDVAAAAGFRSMSRQADPLPLMSGTSIEHGGSNHGHRDALPVFQLGHSTGMPWSPPPPSGTPSGAVSPMSAQSLLSTHNYGGGGNSLDYPHSSSGHGNVDMLGHSGSTSSMRSTIPMIQPAPPFATSETGPYGNARPTHPYSSAYSRGRSGSHQSRFSGLPEI